MTPVHPDASRETVVEAALVPLERVRLSPADLGAVGPTPATLTVAARPEPPRPMSAPVSPKWLPRWPH